jgi:hypothetical protein
MCMSSAISTRDAGRSPRQASDKKAIRRAHTRRNSGKAERYLTEVEKTHGTARAWELRERLEAGDVTLGELKGR